MNDPTLEEDEAFLDELSRSVPGSIPDRRTLSTSTQRARLVLRLDKDRSCAWDYVGERPEGQQRADMTPLGALSGSDMVPLAHLRALWANEDRRREVIAALYHGGKPRTSETWEIWPRLWIGRTPEPGEHIDHDILVRLAQPLAPGVTCRDRVLDICLEDSEEEHHVPLALSTAEVLSLELAAAWHAGQSIRIGCLAGMNRSALVLGAVLCRLGMTGTEAVEHIRWKRGRFALSNAVFHRWLVETFGPKMAAERQAKGPPR